MTGNQDSGSTEEVLCLNACAVPKAKQIDMAVPTGTNNRSVPQRTRKINMVALQEKMFWDVPKVTEN
eukprot:CAMPEP_0172607860 /NCGR_PEP_ID=MMETSP1068-20121228/27997_1 /TAXON_ID=35684 /ORGANISM="Pseudopedinella elastica, Strain CCMP716" /LENGTH=66 /DNA_ID=CAMNT_0013410979 /DNA_START=68 /DNA_END=268 /DNA_ORIENTATION=-